ncbi:unnamed protein product [Pedinophyceae sp. YPF-701]|nr:unnamed protein product [Pedinophyceae sp. YPF-701]
MPRGKGKGTGGKPAKPKQAAKRPKNQRGAKAATEQGPARPQVWRKGLDELGEDEELDYDPTVYFCLHSLSLDWPCLSFDLCKDGFGAPRNAFPHQMLLVAGTQAADARSNYLAVMKLADMGQAGHGPKPAKEGDDSDSDMSESSDDEDEEPPKLHCRQVAHNGGVNRVRACPQHPNLVATWSDAGQVNMFDVEEQLKAVADAKEVKPPKGAQKAQPKQTFGGHSCEGFAMDWSPLTTGRFVSGDCKGRVFLWEPTPAGKWDVGQRKFAGHTGSVEDAQWSPTEPDVFMTVAADRTIRVWDCRVATKPMITLEGAHDADVNVLSWNRLTTHMVATGGDDNALRIWDLRNLAAGRHVAHFNYHRGPVAAVEWCPYESSMLLTCGEDDQLCVWDLALERDPEEEAAMAAELGGERNAELPEDVPPQLLFVHQGQHMLKEAHWHTQIPGMIVSTAGDGFNVFKPFNV